MIIYPIKYLQKSQIIFMKQFKGLIIIFSGFLIMTLLSLILISIKPKSYINFPNDSNQYRHRRAFIIGIDGIGNLPKTVDTPGIHRVINNGIYTYDAQTVYPSLSAESWTTLLHGVGPEKHKIYTKFEMKGDQVIIKKPESTFSLTSPYPSIYRLIYEQKNRPKMACFSNWEYITKNIIEDGIGVFKYFNKSEELVVDQFSKYMESNDPWLVFFQLDDTDRAGHKYGFFSDEHKKQLMKTDVAVSRIIDIIEKYDKNNEDLILIQTDHGGSGDLFSDLKMVRPSYICEKCKHGSKDVLDMTIFWTARGKGICNNKQINNKVSIRDTARFVASYLKLKIPETWDGYNLYPENLC